VNPVCVGCGSWLQIRVDEHANFTVTSGGSFRSGRKGICGPTANKVAEQQEYGLWKYTAFIKSLSYPERRNDQRGQAPRISR